MLGSCVGLYVRWFAKYNIVPPVVGSASKL